MLLGKASQEIWCLEEKIHQDSSQHSLVIVKFFNNHTSEFSHVAVNKVQLFVILFGNWIHSDRVSIIVTVTRQTFTCSK